MHTYLDFEKPIAELEGKIKELKRLAEEDSSVGIGDEVAKLEQKAQQLLTDAYAQLTPWQKVQVARHPARPHFVDIVAQLVTEFTPLAGDRQFGEDAAIMGGLGRFNERPVMVLGHEKGADTQARLKHNFGSPNPEGYRKAVRLMELANRFNVPVVSFVDTPGAYPGIEGEERGQAEAIARAIECGINLSVPFVSIIVGEGNSGGAIAIASANKVFMLEHAVYSVISPEACSSILWRSADKAQDASSALKITAQSMEELGIVDRVLKEPVGGAHREPDTTIAAIGEALEEALQELEEMDGPDLKSARRQKFLEIGRSL